jgi:hypothetical protein
LPASHLAPWAKTLKLIKVRKKEIYKGFTFGQLFLYLPSGQEEETADNYFL